MKSNRILACFMLVCMTGVQGSGLIENLGKDKEEQLTSNDVVAFLHEHRQDSSWFDTLKFTFEVSHDESYNKKQWYQILGRFLALTRSAQRAELEEWIGEIALPMKEVALRLGDKFGLHGNINIFISDEKQKDTVGFNVEIARESVYDGQVWQSLVDMALNLADVGQQIGQEESTTHLEFLKQGFPLVGDIVEIAGAESGIQTKFFENWVDSRDGSTVWVAYSSENKA